MSRKSIDSKRSRSTLGRASREAESPLGWTRTKDGKRRLLAVNRTVK